MSGFSPKNVRYPRYKDTDFLQLWLLIYHLMNDHVLYCLYTCFLSLFLYLFVQYHHGNSCVMVQCCHSIYHLTVGYRHGTSYVTVQYRHGTSCVTVQYRHGTSCRTVLYRHLITTLKNSFSTQTKYFIS